MERPVRTLRQRVFLGDCREVLSRMSAGSVDTVVTDPPYHLTQASRKGSPRVKGTGPYGRHTVGEKGFMGKTWDGGGVAFEPETWAKVLHVCKPGATLLAFGGTRTYHRLACAIEDAGWEIRDCLMWLYGTGFPKSRDISKAIDKEAGASRKVVGRGRRHGGGADIKGGKFHAASEAHADAYGSGDVTAATTDAAKLWDGWGTALKPAWEPIILAMKPLDGTFAANALEHGVAGLNVDGGRIPAKARPNVERDHHGLKGNTWEGGLDGSLVGSKQIGLTDEGRWPANVILDEEAGRQLDEQSGERPATGRPTMKGASSGGSFGFGGADRRSNQHYDSGGASRFFYCAKASRRERNEGLPEGAQNKHPTVKPLALMEYLCKLTATPTGGLVLDPFCGSGSTGVACAKLGRRFIGIDSDEESCAIARRRITHAGRSR